MRVIAKETVVKMIKQLGKKTIKGKLRCNKKKVYDYFTCQGDREEAIKHVS